MTNSPMDAFSYAAFIALFYSARMLFSFRRGAPLTRRQMVACGFLVAGAIFLLAASKFATNSPARLPTYVIAVGAMAWSLLLLLNVVP